MRWRVMMIILNEKKYIESVIEKGEVSSKPSETINLMVKYYKYLGFKKNEVYEKIHEYLLKNYKPYNKVKWEDTINKYIETNFKKGYELIEIDFIPITDKEVDKIKTLKSKRLERLAFTMLVIAKMNNMVSDKNNGWVNKKDKEIFKHANIRTSIKEQCLLLNDLKTKEFIEFSQRVDNTNNKVLFIEEGVAVIKIDDMRNLGYIYDDFVGYGKFKKCEICGEVIKNTSKTKIPKYCDGCIKEKQKEWDREYRNKNKN